MTIKLSLGNEVYGTAQLFKGSSLVTFKERVIIGMTVQFHFQMKKENLSVVQSIKVNKGTGLVGDQFKESSSGKREVTPIQEELLNTISSILGRKKIDPKLTRRNIVVSANQPSFFEAISVSDWWCYFGNNWYLCSLQ